MRHKCVELVDFEPGYQQSPGPVVHRLVHAVVERFRVREAVPRLPHQTASGEAGRCVKPAVPERLKFGLITCLTLDG